MISLKFDWQNPVPINQSASSVPISLNLASIVVVREIDSGGGGAVDSVNGKTGSVVLNADDVGAIDENRLVLALSDRVTDSYVISKISDSQVFVYSYIDAALAQKANMVETSQALATKASTTALAEVRGLAELNEQKVSTKAEKSDLDALKVQVLTKADQEQLEWLIQLVNTMASQDYVIGKMNDLLGGVSGAYDTLKEIADKLQLDDNQFAAILDALGNRVRFDAPQSLTTAQQAQARDNIKAEALGTAATLVGAITPASIGAATAAQGTKANTALQSADIAVAALSGSFWDLVNKTKIFDVGFSAYAIGADAVFAVGDTLGVMLGKAQGQINALWTTVNNKQDKLPTSGTSGQFLANDFTFKTPASSGGQPPWVDLAVLTANAFASGFPDGTNKLQIAKDSSGYIWVKGVFRNTSASPNSNLAIALPTAYMVRQVNTGTTVATPLLLVNSNSSAAGRPTSTFYITGSQFFGLTTGSYDANGTYIIPPTIIGMALNP